MTQNGFDGVKSDGLCVPLAPFNHLVVRHQVLKLFLPNLCTEFKQLVALVSRLLVRGNDFFNLSTSLLASEVGIVDKCASK